MKHLFKPYWILIVPIVCWTNTSTAAPTYMIEVSHNDEFFIIHGEKFEAKTYCFNMEEGDRVVFIDGSPLGVCVSAEIYNVDTRESCELWCE